MTRRDDWVARLDAFAASVRGRPFRWGETDCGSLVRGALEAVYGVPGLPQYASLRAALAVVAEARVPRRLQALGLCLVTAPVRPGDILIEEPKDHGFDECAIVVRDGVLAAELEGVVVRPWPVQPIPVWRQPWRP